MATMVYRGLQSCLESQFIETNWTSHLAQIKLASSNKPQFPPPPFEFSLKPCFNTAAAGDIPPPSPKCIYKTNNPLPIPLPLPLPVVENVGNSDKLPKAAMVSKKEEEVYVHPLVKRSRSTLSEKSLWLCTENLGNETGVDFIAAEGDIFYDTKAESLPTRKRVKSQDVRRTEFPPPLTTISGMDSLHVRSHRENGRLIMEAVKAPSKHPYFHIERSHGRLRLSVLKSADFDFDSNEEEDKTKVDEVKEVDEKCDFEEDVGRKVEEINEYEENVGVEVEIEKIGRTCRCKDGENNIDNNNNNNGMLLNWEPMSMWVATS